MCLEYQRQIDYIEAIEDTCPLGLCHIQLKEMKETALPEPKRLLSMVFHAIPW